MRLIRLGGPSAKAGGLLAAGSVLARTTGDEPTVAAVLEDLAAERR